MTEEKISLNEFQKLDLRVATIKEVKPHPNADKLYILKISLGKEEKQLVAGLKPYYKEKELINKQIIIIVNLQPANLRGIESNGMLLAADDSKGNVVFLTPERKIEENSKIR